MRVPDFEFILLFGWLTFMTVLIMSEEEPETSSEQIPVDQPTQCLNASHTDYGMICYNLDELNVSVDEKGDVETEAVGTVVREEVSP